MSNSKGPSNMRNVMYSGKHALLPPKSPFPNLSPYADYVPNPPVGTKAVQRPREGYAHHQRTSSESFLMEEQPSWLDDLLNEPETPAHKGGHRRSSSDSFAYIDVSSFNSLDYTAQGDHKYRNMVPSPGWRSQDFDCQASLSNEPKYAKHKNKTWELPVHASPHISSALPSSRNNVASQSSGASCPLQDVDKAPPASGEKQDQVEASQNDSKGSSERKDNSRAKSSSSETDTKRAKQQFAQRSRVRKLQYIAELEGNVQALQLEGSEISAEIGFLNQQHLILSMENKALKQRLESLSQEQLIKYMEHEVLEREIVRLRALYQQQQQPPQPSSTRQRSSSKDLDSQFARLSLKPKDSSSSQVTL